MHRLRVDNEQLRSRIIRLRGAELRRLRDVLRLRRGARVELFDGEGASFEAEVIAIGAASADLGVVGALARHVESPLALTLAVALAKGAKLDWVVEKATELGVSRIVPFTCERTVPERGDFASRQSRWRRIADSAAAQSGRTVSPVVDDVRRFTDLCALVANHDRALLFWERGAAPLPAAESGAVARAVVVTGPEGGFTDGEAAQAAEAGFTIATLGPRILRAETAAIVAVALAQQRWGDLGGGGSSPR
jgi:16S rRNA (uracil1498-N3)-methyltransferase